VNLTPIPRNQPAHVACEVVLRTAILRGELEPGERMPPERELAVQLGVSRLTLRAALATLAAAGLVEVRHGSGYIVRDFRDGGPGLLPGLLELATEPEGLARFADDLLRVRRHLAMAVLERFVDHPPTKHALAAIADAVDRLDELATARAAVDELAAADLDVIAALLDATDSAVLRLCLNPVVAVVGHDARLRAALYVQPATNVAAFRALLAWLARPVRADLARVMAMLDARDAATLERLGRGAKRDRSKR
jgi:GntR family transcriptional regulator, transcriptional repressor for pyruvate dehydrogenase complex